jgi:hypothetical protein
MNQPRGKKSKNDHKERKKKSVEPVAHKERHQDVEGEDATEKDQKAEMERDILLM